MEDKNHTVYTNNKSKRSTIHIGECNQIEKNGGVHKYEQGYYEKFSSFEEAFKYCNNGQAKEDNQGNIIKCSFCYKNK